MAMDCDPVCSHCRMRKAKVFRCGVDGGRLKKAKKSFWDDFLINFLEQCE